MGCNRTFEPCASTARQQNNSLRGLVGQPWCQERKTSNNHLNRENPLNKKLLFAAGGLVLLLILLRACGDDAPQVMAQQPAITQDSATLPLQQPAQVIAPPAPIMVQPAAPVVVHDHDNSGFMSGLLMGHLMGSGGSNSSNVTRNTTVINKHYNTQRAPSARPAKKYYGNRPAYRSRPAYKPASSFRRR